MFITLYYNTVKYLIFLYLSVLLCVHLKNDVFPISPPLYQGNTLSLTNVVTYPHCFLTAYKRLWRWCVLAGMSVSTKPRPIQLLAWAIKKNKSFHSSQAHLVIYVQIRDDQSHENANYVKKHHRMRVSSLLWCFLQIFMPFCKNKNNS